MRRSYCLLSAAVLLALGVIGLAVPTRESVPPVVTEAPEATPAPAASEPVEMVLKRGETLEAALRRTGVERTDAAAIVAALRGSVNMRRLAPGERLTVQPGVDGKPAAISYARSPAERYEIRPGPDGRWAVNAVRPDVDTRVVAIIGEVRDSLFASMERLGETAALTAGSSNLFEWDFDFAADSLPGDRFRLLVEKRYVGDNFLGYGDVLVAQYASHGHSLLTERRVRRHHGPPRVLRRERALGEEDVPARPARLHPRHLRLLARALPPGAGRLPAAPRGGLRGPDRHAGARGGRRRGHPGGLERRLRAISISLRHGRGYETMYNHLSKIDVRPGQRVRQRQVIGRVGSTGLSTAPHLDYRVRKGGVLVNPLGEKFIPGAPVPAHRREAFAVHVDALLERLDAQAPFPARPPGRS